MAEYIDREQAEIMAIDGADKWDGGYNYERELAIQEAIRRIPSADVVEVVRCKDCKHYKPQFKSRHWQNKKNYCCRSSFAKVNDFDYCSYGERKDT